jgi:hypothetical protein
LWNIYNDIKNEANYEFFNLFKFEHLQPNTFWLPKLIYLFSDAQCYLISASYIISW